MSLRLSVFVRVCVALGIVASASAPAAELISGRWEGTIEIPGRSTTLIIDLDKDATSAWVGSAVMPGFGVKGAPLAHLTLNGTAIAFTIQGVLGDPAVKAQIGGDTITGEFSDAGNSAPLTLHKIGPAQVDLPPKSTLVQHEYEGEWAAQVMYGGSPLKLKLAVKNGVEAASATLVAIRTKENPFPVTLVRQDGRFLMLNAGPVELEATFDRGSGEIRGTARIGGVEMPVAFHKEAAK